MIHNKRVFLQQIQTTTEYFDIQVYRHLQRENFSDENNIKRFHFKYQFSYIYAADNYTLKKRRLDECVFYLLVYFCFTPLSWAGGNYFLPSLPYEVSVKDARRF